MTMTTATPTRTLTINDIQSAMRARGSHWWDPGTMRSFGSRVHSQVYSGPGGIYFVTSEQMPYSGRACTVRQYLPDASWVENVGDVSSQDREAAHEIASRMARTPIAEQLNAALQRLDLAVSGKSVQRYSSPELIYTGEAGLGGHMHVRVHHYGDGWGVYLELFAAPGDDAEGTRERFGAVYGLRREVCLLLETWHELQAGEVTGANEPHREVTELEQCIHDCTAHGCTISRTQAKRLIQLATRYQHHCVQDCNVPDYPQRHRTTAGNKIRKLAAEIGASGVILGGDPRGCTVKLTFTDGETDDHGGEGWCVPREG